MNTLRSYVPGRTAEIRTGGSELLLAFVEEAVRLGATRLLALAPYVDDALLADDGFRPWWDDLLRSTEATIVVRTPQAAEVIARSFGRTAGPHDVRVSPRLHAKVYLAHRNGLTLALAGSHNLTGAALRSNLEAGLLIAPGTNDALRRVVRELRSTAEDVARRSVRWRGPVGGPA